MKEKYPILNSTQEAKDYIKNKTNGEYIIIGGDYNNKGRSKFEFKHTCGNTFFSEFREVRRSFLNSGGGCPICANSKRSKNLSPKLNMDDFKEKFKQFENSKDYEILSKEYVDNKTKIEFKHNICGKTFTMRPNDFQQGYRCPHCSRMKSVVENELADFVKSIYSGTVKTSDRKLINPYELDIYLPEKKLAIEFNGLYWHGEKQKGKNYHKKKMELCNKKGVRLIQLFEDEWSNQTDIVKSKIENIMGESKKEKIYARKCLLKEVELEEAKEFMNKNHIQGYTPSTVKIGLFHEEKLVSLMLLNKLRAKMNKNNYENAWDLIRFASDIDKIIIGSFGKILKYFIQTYNPNYIKTLADLRWSDPKNNMYEKFNFNVANKVEPRYFYTDGKMREHRFKFRKDKIKENYPEVYNEKLTEFQMMDKTNLWRIWDAGKITYEYIPK